ncbi:MAG: nucleotidyl transferase AbiEii/AbiGii toxin family protein [Alphaproteobacteria bacterium]|nr:nucleotidyl transferase AbiEii/AbiGii toxin family protein [Alphaproteobacteria bacterium]
MSEATPKIDPKDIVVVDIASWVERARSDPQAYLERQATEVFIAAIGITPSYASKVFLKGGVLMGIRYDSPRQTADLDFTASFNPKTVEIGDIRAEFDDAVIRAAAQIGYPSLVCRVQTVRARPRQNSLEIDSFPALEMKIAYALRDSPQEIRLRAGQCPTILEADISFNEPIDAIQVVRLGKDGPEIKAYSLLDLIAEKLRALLQQVVRNRYRRQDVYDLAYLVERFSLDRNEKAHLLQVFRTKSASRGINPDRNSLSRPQVVQRARAEWDTLTLELGDLPNFEERFEIVNRLYRSLPW